MVITKNVCYARISMASRSVALLFKDKTTVSQLCLLYNRGYNAALPWQRLFRYIILILVAMLRPTDIGKKQNHHIGH